LFEFYLLWAWYPWEEFCVTFTACTGRRLSRTYRNKLEFLRRRILAPRPTPKLEDLPLSAFRHCLFSIFASTAHMWRPSPPSATWGRVMQWWQGIHLTWTFTAHTQKHTWLHLWEANVESSLKQPICWTRHLNFQS
jgi:hypothetical protein